MNKHVPFCYTVKKVMEESNPKFMRYAAIDLCSGFCPMEQ